MTGGAWVASSMTPLVTGGAWREGVREGGEGRDGGGEGGGGSDRERSEWIECVRNEGYDPSRRNLLRGSALRQQLLCSLAVLSGWQVTTLTIIARALTCTLRKWFVSP